MSNIPATPLLNDHVVRNGCRLAGKHHLLNRAKSARVQMNVEPRGQNPEKPLDILAQRFLQAGKMGFEYGETKNGYLE